MIPTRYRIIRPKLPSQEGCKLSSSNAVAVAEANCDEEAVLMLTSKLVKLGMLADRKEFQFGKWVAAAKLAIVSAAQLIIGKFLIWQTWKP
jgi:hypothetical protein